jgi:hypothetical protein
MQKAFARDKNIGRNDAIKKTSYSGGVAVVFDQRGGAGGSSGDANRPLRAAAVPRLRSCTHELLDKRRWLRAADFALCFALARLTPSTNLLAFCTGVG